MNNLIDETALDKAAREGYAIRCKTHDPRVLDQYADPHIMQMQLDNARVIISAYLSALSTPAVREPGSVPDGWVLVPQAALDWLFGEGPDPAGFHFGDWPEDIPRPQGAFWWRSVFRQILAAAPQPK